MTGGRLVSDSLPPVPPVPVDADSVESPPVELRVGEINVAGNDRTGKTRTYECSMQSWRIEKLLRHCELVRT